MSKPRPSSLARRRRWEVTVRSIALAAGLPTRLVRSHVNAGKVRPWDTASLTAYVAGQRAISEAGKASQPAAAAPVTPGGQPCPA